MRVLQAIFLSIGIHILLVLLLQNIPLPSPRISPTQIEIDVLSQNETKPKDLEKRQVVRQAILPESFKVQNTEDKLKFLAEKLQRVKEQTRAAISGVTENRNNSQGKQSTSTSKITASPNKTDSKFDPFARRKVFSAPNQNNYQEQHSQDAQAGFSTIAESVDVKVGVLTALNTDQYLFYSFFKRINELVYIRWAGLVQAAEERVAPALAGKTYNDKWTTMVDIWVRPNGEFHSAHLLKESGVAEFDRAAIAAFRQSGLFPNPPQELVEEDGFVHLRYNLTVFFEPKAYVER